MDERSNAFNREHKKGDDRKSFFVFRFFDEKEETTEEFTTYERPETVQTTVVQVTETTSVIESTTAQKITEITTVAEETTRGFFIPEKAIDMAQSVISSQWTVIILFVIVVLLLFSALRLRHRNKKLMSKSERGSDSDNVVTTIELENKVQDISKTMELPCNVKQTELFVKCARVHNIGTRTSQQDSFGVSDITNEELCNKKGVLAVVADGMGGLEGGDEISSSVVLQFLQKFTDIASNLTPENELSCILDETVENINYKLLSEHALKKSGSTVISVIIKDRMMSWISVGDSRIALYRNGQIIDLNKKHIYAAELAEKVKLNLITPQEAADNPEKDKLTSYIGMGALKYVDKSVRPMPLQPKDKIILMTDGVFNTLSDEKIKSILRLPIESIGYSMEREIIGCANPYQDNFTAVVFEIQ